MLSIFGVKLNYILIFEKGKADAVNDMFTKVFAHVPPLNTAKLPAYLSGKDPPSTFTPGKFTLS